jgi:hypothetical protein
MLLPHTRPSDKLLGDLEEVINRDKEFIVESHWLLFKWRCLAHAMSERFRDLLESGTRDDSSSS